MPDGLSEYGPTSGKQSFVAPMKDALLDMSMAYDNAHQPGGGMRAQELYDRFIDKWFALKEVERKIFLNQMDWNQFDRIAHQFRWLAGSGKIDPHDSEKFTEDLIKRGGMTPAFRRKITRHQEEVTRGTGKMAGSEYSGSGGYWYVAFSKVRELGRVHSDIVYNLMVGGKVPPQLLDILGDQAVDIDTIGIFNDDMTFVEAYELITDRRSEDFGRWMNTARAERRVRTGLGLTPAAMERWETHTTRGLGIAGPSRPAAMEHLFNMVRGIRYEAELASDVGGIPRNDPNPVFQEMDKVEATLRQTGTPQAGMALNRLQLARQYVAEGRWDIAEDKISDAMDDLGGISGYVGERAIKFRKGRVAEAKEASKYPDESYGMVTRHVRREGRERRQDARSDCTFKSACMSEFGMSSSDFDKYTEEAGKLKLGAIMGTGFAIYNPITLIPFIYYRLRGEDSNNAMTKAYQLIFDIMKVVVSVVGGAKLGLAVQAIDKPVKAMTEVEVSQAGSMIRQVMKDPHIFRAAVRSLRHVMSGLRQGKITDADISRAAEEGVQALSEFTTGESVYDLIAVLPDLGMGPQDVDPKQLAMGIEVEHEHTLLLPGEYDPFAERIALAHLQEDPKYYDHLKVQEDKYSKKDYLVFADQLQNAMRDSRPDVLHRFERIRALIEMGEVPEKFTEQFFKANEQWISGKHEEAMKTLYGATASSSGHTESSPTEYHYDAAGKCTRMVLGYEEGIRRKFSGGDRKPSPGRGFVAVFEDSVGQELTREQNDRQDAFEECINVVQSRRTPYVKAIWYDKDGKAVDEKYARKDHQPYKW